VSINSLATTGLQKIQRGPLREQVHARIRQLILTNSLHPDQPLSIDWLSGELGVSHTPVREALAMLQHDGLVTMRPYEVPRVATIEVSDVREAWEMRLLLEGWAVSQASLTLPDDVLQEMADWLERARPDAERSLYAEHLQSDLALHEMILRAPGNRLFDRLAELVSDQSIRIRSLVESIAPSDKVLLILDEHRAIVQGLQARDPDLAYGRLIAHLEGGLERTLSALEQIRASRERAYVAQDLS
jgi:DNA-binding GntR family transcriptional regulator